MTKPLPYLQIFDLLTKQPELTAIQIGNLLDMDKSQVNAILYRSPRVFVADGGQRPKWSARSIPRRNVTKLLKER